MERHDIQYLAGSSTVSVTSASPSAYSSAVAGSIFITLKLAIKISVAPLAFSLPPLQPPSSRASMSALSTFSASSGSSGPLRWFPSEAQQLLDLLLASLLLCPKRPVRLQRRLLERAHPVPVVLAPLVTTTPSPTVTIVSPRLRGFFGTPATAAPPTSPLSLVTWPLFVFGQSPAVKFSFILAQTPSVSISSDFS